MYGHPRSNQSSDPHAKTTSFHRLLHDHRFFNWGAWRARTVCAVYGMVELRKLEPGLDSVCFELFRDSPTVFCFKCIRHSENLQSASRRIFGFTAKHSIPWNRLPHCCNGRKSRPAKRQKGSRKIKLRARRSIGLSNFALTQAKTMNTVASGRFHG